MSEGDGSEFQLALSQLSFAYVQILSTYFKQNAKVFLTIYIFFGGQYCEYILTQDFRGHP